MTAGNGRKLNYELLRITAMFMIVCLHYLSKGGILGEPSNPDMSITSYAAWLIEAFCLVAVNVYVLISGYFSNAGTDKMTPMSVLKKPFAVWKQVLFYSISVGIIALFTGLQSFDIYTVFTYIFPIVTEHYWFATSYIILCLFMPFLNMGAYRLDKKSLGALTGAFLLVFCVAKTVIPMQLPWDKSGYDAFWFAALYLTGIYIRRFGISLIDSRIKAAALYIVCELLVFASFIVLRIVYFRTGSFGRMINYGYSYNYLFCYAGAVGFFLMFSDRFGVSSKNEAGILEKFRKPIELVSGAAFGVYLLHEHINIRYLWPEWFNCKAQADSPLWVFLLHMFITAAVVYAVCTLIEILRKKLMGRVQYLFALILLLYPLRHAFTGIDLMDAGYALGNYRFFDVMNDMWRLATYLSNVIGVFLSKLPCGGTWAGMNIYSGLLIGAAAAASYIFILKRYGSEKKVYKYIFFAAELAALSFCWAPNVILYHYLGYIFMTVASLVLFDAVVSDNKKGLFAAGIILGLCMAVRMPNITYMAFIIPVWYYLILNKEKAGRIINRTLICIGGYASGLAVPLIYISFKYGIGAYPDMICSLFGVTKTAVDYKPTSMLAAVFGDYMLYGAWLVLFAVYGAAGIAVFKAIDVIKKEESRIWDKIIFIVKIMYILGMTALIRLCYGRGMFGFNYAEYFCMYKWMAVYLITVIIACVLTIIFVKNNNELRLWAVFLLVIVFVTPLGSNNGLYPVINNMFLTAPVSLYIFDGLFGLMKAENGFSKNKLFVIKSVCILILLCTAVQGILFGISFVFHDLKEADSERVEITLKCSSPADGMKTTEDKKQALEGLDEYIYINGLNKNKIMLFGDIPSLSYIFDMEPAIFTTWPDLDSSSLGDLEADLNSLYEKNETPVIIIGKKPSNSAIESVYNEKLGVIENFIGKSGYAEAYQNEMFVLYSR